MFKASPSLQIKGAVHILGQATLWNFQPPLRSTVVQNESNMMQIC